MAPVSSTVTPGSTAPCSSETIPVMVPVWVAVTGLIDHPDAESCLVEPGQKEVRRREASGAGLPAVLDQPPQRAHEPQGQRLDALAPVPVLAVIPAQPQPSLLHPAGDLQEV